MPAARLGRGAFLAAAGQCYEFLVSETEAFMYTPRQVGILQQLEQRIQGKGFQYRGIGVQGKPCDDVRDEISGEPALPDVPVGFGKMRSSTFSSRMAR